MRFYDQKKTPAHARAHIKKSVSEFRKLLIHRLKQLKLSPRDRRKVMALMGDAKLAGELRHSNLRAWGRFVCLVINEVRDLHRSNDLDFFHVTMLADEGIRSDRQPYIPLDPMKRKADKSLRFAKVEGIVRFEVAPLMNWPGRGKGRTLLCHMHALVWAEKGTHTATSLSVAIQMGPRTRSPWKSKFDAIPVLVKPITAGMGSPAYWAAYILKMPYEALNLMKRKKDDDSEQAIGTSYRMMSTTKGFRPEFAMLLFEMFSQLGLQATVSGVGGGAEILRRCRARCRERMKHHYARRQAVPMFKVRRLMRETRRFRRKRYNAFFIDGRTLD